MSKKLSSEKKPDDSPPKSQSKKHTSVDKLMQTGSFIQMILAQDSLEAEKTEREQFNAYLNEDDDN